MNTIFVFAYYSYKDPVFQSAVLPYLKLVKNKDLRFVLLTWEQKEHRLPKNEAQEIKKALLRENIIWKQTNWHSGRLKFLKKLFDFIKGLILSIYLILKFKARKIYSEGFPGSVIGHFLSLITKRKHIVHTFEPHADYMKDAGVWLENSWEYKLLKKLEVPIAKRCEHIITGTTAYKKKLLDMGVLSSIWVIPSCIDFNHFKFKQEARRRIRKELRIKQNQIVVVYMGKMGGMYMEEEIFQFFRHLLTIDSEIFQFILLTNAKKEVVIKHCVNFNIPSRLVKQFYVSKEMVPEFLSASDIGFCGVRPIPSQKYSSPIKNGEYWACGLPVVIPTGIASDDQSFLSSGMGISFTDFRNLDKNTICSLIIHDRTNIRQKAFEIRDISNYKNRYEEIFLN